MRVHPSEAARLTRQSAASPFPGSEEEADALRRIDEARADEVYELHLSRSAARRRARSYWRDRGHQLDGQ